MKNWLAGALGALSIVACSGPATVDGTVAGHGLDTKDGVVSLIADPGFIAVFVSDVDGVCEAVQSNTLKKGETFLMMALAQRENETFVTPTPGEYLIDSDGCTSCRAAVVSFWRVNAASCETNDVSQDAESGKVVLSSYDAAKGAKGTFELHFAGGDKLTGEFDVPFCEMPATTPAVVCQ